MQNQPQKKTLNNNEGVYDRDKMMIAILTKLFKIITRMADAIISVQEVVLVLCAMDNKEAKKKYTEKIKKSMENNKKENEKREIMKQMKIVISKHKRENQKRYKQTKMKVKQKMKMKATIVKIKH